MTAEPNQEPCWIKSDAGRKDRRFFQNTVRRLTNVDRNALRHLVDQSPVILMSMRDDETKERRVLFAKPGHVWQGNEFVTKRTQRPANVEDNPRIGCFDLNTAAADFVSAAMDSDSHLLHRSRLYKQL